MPLVTFDGLITGMNLLRRGLEVPSGPDRRDIASGSAHVWVARPVSDSATITAGLLELLSDEELATRGRFARERDRDLYTTAHALARIALTQVVGGTPKRDAVQAEGHRRPRLPGRPALDLSLSHTDGLVAVAIARDARCGVDVETATHRPVLSPAVLTAAEREAVTASGGRAEVTFARYWTLKEALSKVSGQGLSLPFGGIELTGPGVEPRIVRGHHLLTVPDAGPNAWTLAHRTVRYRGPGQSGRWDLALALHAVPASPATTREHHRRATPAEGRAAGPTSLRPDGKQTRRRRPIQLHQTSIRTRPEERFSTQAEDS